MAKIQPLLLLFNQRQPLTCPFANTALKTTHLKTGLTQGFSSRTGMLSYFVGENNNFVFVFFQLRDSTTEFGDRNMNGASNMAFIKVFGFPQIHQYRLFSVDQPGGLVGGNRLTALYPLCKSKNVDENHQ